MKIFIFLFLFIPCILKGQVSVNLKGGASTYWFIGGELQTISDTGDPNVSVTLEWRPQVISGKTYMNGYGISGRFYLLSGQTTPYFSTGIITHGEYKIDSTLYESTQSMPITIGVRLCPWDFSDQITNRLSFDIELGLELFKYKSAPYVEISAQFTLFE